MIKTRSIRNEFIIWILLVCILPFIIGMVYIKHCVFKQVQADFQLKAHQATSRVQRIIDKDIIDPAFKAVTLLAIDDRTREMIDNIGDKKITTEDMLDKNLYKSFVNYQNMFTDMTGFAVATEKGGYFQYPNFYAEAQYDPRTRSWYQGALQNQTDTFLTDPYTTEYGEIVVSITRAIERDKKPIGVAVAGWNMQELQWEIDKLKIGQSGYIIILNKDNKIILSPRNNWFMKTPEEVNFPEISAVTEADNIQYVSFEGKKQLVNITRSFATGWKIVALVDQAELINNIYSYLWPIFLTCSTMVAFILIFIFLATKRNVIEPLQCLTKKAAALADGNLDVRVNFNKDNEFGVLAQTFNDMVSKIKKYIEKISQQNEILYKQEKEFKTLVENAEDIILRVDDNLNILYINPISQKYTAQKSANVLGQNLAALGMPDSLLRTIRYIYDNTSITKTMLIEFEFTPNKEIFYNFQAHVIPEFYSTEEPKTVLLIIRDITQQKLMEQQITRLDRLNIIGETAAGIAHEVRNPMTTVRGFLQMLSSKNQKYMSYYNLMIDEIDRANIIITEFLSLAKNKMVNRTYINLNDIVTAIAPLLQSNATMNNKIVKLDLAEVHELLLDSKEIRQLIINLTRNALEATTEKGEVLIRTYEAENAVILAIKDNGPGIKPEILKNLGMPFQTTKDNGTGLGLPICYSIAARHNAKITVETGEDGTEFFVSFTITTNKGV